MTFTLPVARPVGLLVQFGERAVLLVAIVALISPSLPWLALVSMALTIVSVIQRLSATTLASLLATSVAVWVASEQYAGKWAMPVSQTITMRSFQDGYYPHAALGAELIQIGFALVIAWIAVELIIREIQRQRADIYPASHYYVGAHRGA